jgi:hypothetical protein
MKIFKLLLMVVVVALLFSNCKYNFIVPIEVPPTDPDNPDTTEVSFSADVEPIFNNGNFCTSCHTAGKTPPDLSTGNAYSSLNSTRYLNTATPEESMIYEHPHPQTTTHMQKKYNSAQAAIILRWIQQGAKNN